MRTRVGGGRGSVVDDVSADIQGGMGGKGYTHAAQFHPAVTAFWRRAFLLDVQVSKFAARGLDDADSVALGVVRLPSPL